MYAQTNFTTVPPGYCRHGLNKARLVRFIEIGTQTITFKGIEKPQRQGLFVFELSEPEYFKVWKEGNPPAPKVITKKLALSLYGKSFLMQYIQNWFGDTFNEHIVNREFSPHMMMGKPCLINVMVGQNRNTNEWYEEIIDIQYLRESDCMPLHNEIVCMPLTHFDVEIFNKLPKWQRRLLGKSVEYPELKTMFPDMKID